MRRLDRTDFDVIVLGSGLSGSFTASILARHGHSVLIIDKGVHPRFTIGESTIPQLAQVISLVSRKYDVPELAVLGLLSPESIRKQIAPTSGVKNMVGFVYHEFGKEHDPAQAHQFGNSWRRDNHFFRQDVDAWLLNLAMKYGSEVLHATKVEGVELGDDKVTVKTDNGSYNARFIVDGSGFRSLLANMFDLREKPTSMVHRSRSIFTHMVGLKDFEEVAESHMTHRYRGGTLHHLFKRGWFWVIPFNNWEGSTNPIVSVGLTMDDEVYPEDSDLDPEGEFEKFVEMLPSVSAHFEDARAVRPWVRSKRIQYSSKKSIGDRFALLSHTAGFVDPLYSRGLISTIESVDEICDALLEALKDDEFHEDRFAGVERVERKTLSFADRVVHASYVSWDDFDLWDRWLRVWAIGVHVAESRLGSVLVMGKMSWVKQVEEPAFSAYEDPGYRAFFESSYDVMLRYANGEVTVPEAIKQLDDIRNGYDFKMPLRDQVEGQEWAMKNPAVRDLFLGQKDRHERWAKGEVDAHLSELVEV